MITWFGVRDETSSGILYSLQWLKGRLRKSREHSIAVVEATQYQRGDEPLRNLLAYWKNVNNFGLDKAILHQIIWEDAPRRRGDDHVTKSRNRKLIRETSSNKCLKHTCIDLSNYNR